MVRATSSFIIAYASAFSVTDQPIIERNTEEMPKLDIKKEIVLNADKCKGLLERFQAANLVGKDLIDATDIIADGNSPLHEVMRSCQGENVLELVEYLVEMHPKGVQAKDAFGNLPIHVMPRFASPANNNKESIQRDQLPARRFLMTKYPGGVKKRNNRGETPLVKAIFLEYNIFVQSIATDFPNIVTEPDEFGKLPLQYAIESWNDETVKIVLRIHPEAITSMREFPPGDEADRQRLLAAIAEGVPETFDIDCTSSCGNQNEECQCKPSNSLINQFFAEAKLEKWGQEVMWRLMKSSLHRKRLALPEKVLKLSVELSTEKAENEQLGKDLIETQNAQERTKQKLKVAKVVLESTMKQLEQHKVLAQEQEAKYIEVAMQIQCLQETRNFNTESKFLSKIDHEWSVAELKAVLESLVQRLGYLIPEHTKLSMAQIAASYLVQDDDPPKLQLIDTIEALNQELLEL
jgi:hypothetical protein